MDATTTYFTFETTTAGVTETNGLLRRTRTKTGETLSYMNAGAWVDDASLIRHFMDGDIVEVGEGKAGEIAASLGGALID